MPWDRAIQTPADVQWILDDVNARPHGQNTTALDELDRPLAWRARHRRDGHPLDRLAVLPDPGPDWPDVVGALINGLDVVAVRTTEPSLNGRRVAAGPLGRKGACYP